ncbi:MAG: sensor histidine kinase [Spirochaetaceae bacterium]|nr:sensor histidine kinase [Spirochaetaceae bacterium]MDT8297848.1 sensor histidine kinase [Spirochaetaceae bacterium]
MSPVPVETYYAPSARLDSEQISYQLRDIVDEGRITEVLNAAPYIAMITNSARQIVFGNTELLRFLDIPADLLDGQRPGEILGCSHSADHPGGCGTGRNCRFCGLVGVLLESWKSEQRVMDEARLFIQQKGKAIACDVRVTASPLHIGSDLFLLVFLDDISSQKKRERLERTFFHDVMNTAGGVKNLAMYLAETGCEKAVRTSRMLVEQSSLLIEEIRSQRLLIDAESDILAISPRFIDSLVLFTEAGSAAESLKESEHRSIEYLPASPYVDVYTDPVLVKRVLLNMLKNALEATPAGGHIRFEMEYAATDVTFRVWNLGAIPDEVGSQIFHRSFSTKGPGRGTGTYSMRLITEQYLDGSVSFVSDKESGTQFEIRIPRKPCFFPVDQRA